MYTHTPIIKYLQSLLDAWLSKSSQQAQSWTFSPQLTYIDAINWCFHFIVYFLLILIANRFRVFGGFKHVYLGKECLELVLFSELHSKRHCDFCVVFFSKRYYTCVLDMIGVLVI